MSGNWKTTFNIYLKYDNVYKRIQMFDRIYLTGFLPFTGVKINPTELIVKDFMENPHPNVVKATRLDVSVKEVDQYLEKTKE